MIRFHQFDLPVPIYDDAISDISCRSASLDILPYREDINKMALEGRFCGRHIPGKMHSRFQVSIRKLVLNHRTNLQRI